MRNKWNGLAMVIGLTLGGLLSGLTSGCTPEAAIKRHEARNAEWMLCAADRRSYAGCKQ